MCVKKGLKMPSASRTPWDGAPESDIAPAQALVARAHRMAYEARHAPLGSEAAFFNRYERARCPRCGSGFIRWSGFDVRGIGRWPPTRRTSRATRGTPATCRSRGSGS